MRSDRTARMTITITPTAIPALTDTGKVDDEEEEDGVPKDNTILEDTVCSQTD